MLTKVQFRQKKVWIKNFGQTKIKAKKNQTEKKFRKKCSDIFMKILSGLS